jgi:N-acetylneuraminate epimerase
MSRQIWLAPRPRGKVIPPAMRPSRASYPLPSPQRTLSEKRSFSKSLCYPSVHRRVGNVPHPMKFWTALTLLVASHACAAEAMEALKALQWRPLAPLPDPIGVAGPFAGASSGGLLVAGGAHFPTDMPWAGGAKVWTDRVWFLAKKNGEWKAAGNLPRPLAYGVSVTFLGKVWCIGGSDAARHYPDVFSLEWSSGRLVHTAAAALPAPLASAAGAVDREGNLFVACGSGAPGETSASNRFFTARLNDKELHWRELPPLPAEPRILAVAASHDGAFYIFGGAALDPANGKTVRRYLRDCWSYSPGGGWRRIADLPAPAVAAASPAPFVRGRLWVISGDDGSLAGFAPAAEHPGFPGAVYAYDPGTDLWRSEERAPAPRVTLPCVEWGEDFVLPSGEIRPGVRSPEVWCFSK